MIERVICGFQTGADLAGARAAKRCNIPTGGWIPRGWLTETPDGRGVESHPEFETEYGAKQHTSPLFPPRTLANIKDCAFLLWFGDPNSRGGRLTLDTIRDLGQRSYEIVKRSKGVWTPDQIAGMIKDIFVVQKLMQINPERRRILLVAGNRESKSPGIGQWVEEYLVETFTRLKEIEPL